MVVRKYERGAIYNKAEHVDYNNLTFCYSHLHVLTLPISLDQGDIRTV